MEITTSFLTTPPGVDGPMKTSEQTNQGAETLVWLATLLTGCRETAAEVIRAAVAQEKTSGELFSGWMLSWSRRLVIVTALATAGNELAASARQDPWTEVENTELPPASWRLHPETTRAELEQALLSIDILPRVAVLLVVFERVPLIDAALLLNAELEQVHRALAVGVRSLTINLCNMQSGIKRPSLQPASGQNSAFASSQNPSARCGSS